MRKANYATMMLSELCITN